MRVLVTGAAGFLGSHVVDALLAQGHQAYGVDDLSTGRREWCACELIVGEFSEVPLRADVVVHCAAVADISRNWAVQDNRDAIYATNVDSLLVLLERFQDKETRPKQLIFISTAAVTAPQVSPYTASKIAGEAFCQAYCQALGISLVIVRPVSMLGPRYTHGHVADFVRQVEEHGRIVAAGDVTRALPYTHVKHAAAHITAREGLDGPMFFVGWGGRRWRAADTAALLRAECANGPARIGDPDVDRYEPGSPVEWVQETIDWLKANRPWERT